MPKIWPLLFAGALVGVFTIAFFIAWLEIRKEKAAIGFDRNVPDSEIIRRLMVYAKPHWKSFLLVLVIMILSISYELVSPLIVGKIESMVAKDFIMSDLLIAVAVYKVDGYRTAQECGRTIIDFDFYKLTRQHFWQRHVVSQTHENIFLIDMLYAFNT